MELDHQKLSGTREEIVQTIGQNIRTGSEDTKLLRDLVAKVGNAAHGKTGTERFSMAEARFLQASSWPFK
jgi:hypothetical protein